jgi:hypothetical protein
MRFEELDPKTLSRIGTPEATARAQALVKGQKVQHGYRLADRLRGVVLDLHPYAVEVRIQDDQQLSYVCACPHLEEGELCDHVLALLWAWVEESGKFLHQKDLQEKLKKYSKKELVEIILDLADRVPEVRVVLKEEEEGLEDILESIDRVVEEVSSDSPSLAEVEAKLRRAQVRADRLAQSGRLSEARSIYFYMLDNILGLEERLKKGQIFSPEMKKELFEEYCQFIHEDRHLEKELVQAEIEQLESRSLITGESFDLSDVKRELALG